ncbi:MAG TPA: ABC transporter substrate-binding protein, partial [Chloroflexota bacterium]|nr:ABC transporter substrate-binding protein [Chloroflexota bacterium]
MSMRLRVTPAWCLGVVLALATTACGSQTSAPPSAVSSAAPASAAASGASAKPASSAGASAKPAGSASASASGAADGQLRKVTLAWATQTSVFLVPQVGIQAGIFKNHGIDLNLIYTGSGPTAIASLISGDVQFIELADPSVTTSALKGSGVEWVAVSVPKPNLALFVHPNINSVADLKGKKVGVTTLGSLTALMGQYIIQQNGLDPKKDVQIIAIGGGLEAQSAIVNNQVDAIVT